MKKLLKKIVRFINVECFNLYQIYSCRRQIKNLFLKPNDKIDDDYKKNIEIYWAKFGIRIKNYWHMWYSSRNGIVDVRYIPEDIYYSKIEPFYNKREFGDAISDKTIYSEWFKSVKMPKVIAKNQSGIVYDDNFNLINAGEILKKCPSNGTVLVKPSIESGGGKGIVFINLDQLSDKTDLLNVLNKFGESWVLQERILQHEKLNKINSTSVNTIRTISFLHDGEVYILSSILRMGINGALTDNETSGGISCGILHDGKLKDIAYDRFGNAYTQHPQGTSFGEICVPGFNKVINAVKEIHCKFGHFKLISWDFAVDKNEEPVLIEFNLTNQGINFHQMDNGPLFGELTDRVLEEVFGKK